MTGPAGLPRRTPGSTLDGAATAVRRRAATGRARVPGEVRWATDPATIRRVLDGLRAMPAAERATTPVADPAVPR